MKELTRFPPTPREKNATDRVTRLAERQFGVISRAQLLSCGIPNSKIGRWLDQGRLHRVFRGVYAVGHRPFSSEARFAAALLSAGPGAALSHSSAAWWWEIVPHKPRTIEISAPGRRASTAGVRLHRPRDLRRTWHRGLPVTPVPATLLAIASHVEYRELRRALSEALYLDLTDLGSVRAVLGHGHTGGDALRRAIASHEPRLARTRSVLERRFIELCERENIPLPQVNVKVAGFTVDALWADRRVAVELDSQGAHGTPIAVADDRRRDLALRSAGYQVLRYTWEQVTERAADVAADLRAALAAG